MGIFGFLLGHAAPAIATDYGSWVSWLRSCRDGCVDRRGGRDHGPPVGATELGASAGRACVQRVPSAESLRNLENAPRERAQAVGFATGTQLLGLFVFGAARLQAVRRDCMHNKDKS